MNHQQWSSSDDLAAMLEAVRDKMSPRKLRLFASACMGADGGRSWGEWVEDGPRPGDISALDGALYWIGVKVGQNHPRRVSSTDKARFASALRCIAGNPFRPATLPWKATYSPVFGADRTCPWFTPDVLRLSQVAYEDRAEDGSLNPQILLELSDALEEAGCPLEVWSECPRCGGTGEDRKLVSYCSRFMFSCAELAIPCDCGSTKRCDEHRTALSPHPLLAHLRTGKHYRGCHVIDLLTGRE